MDLSPAQLEAMLRQVIQEEVTGHVCRFTTVTDADAAELGHLMGMVKDLDDDQSLAGGIEAMRDNHKWFQAQRELGSKVGTAIINTGIGALVLAVLSVLLLGLQKFMGPSQ